MSYMGKQQVRCTYCAETTKMIEDYHAGDVICSGCGLVVGDRIIDVGVEWRKFSNDSINKSRVGSQDNTLYDEMNLSTRIAAAPTCKSIYCDNSGQDKPYRNKKYLTSSQRAIMSGFKEIAEMAEKLNSTRSVVENGQMLFKKMKCQQALKGNSNESIAAACLYVAYRNNNVARTLKEICAVSKASKRDIAKCYKIFSKEIGQVIMQASTVDYIPRFVAHLQLPNKIEKMAKEYVAKIDTIGILSSRSPITIASLAILLAMQQVQIIDSEKTSKTKVYMHTHLKKTIKTITDVTGVAESTIKDVYHILKQQATNFFPEIFNKSI